jgi:hypothetical protein
MDTTADRRSLRVLHPAPSRAVVDQDDYGEDTDDVEDMEDLVDAPVEASDKRDYAAGHLRADDVMPAKGVEVKDTAVPEIAHCMRDGFSPYDMFLDINRTVLHKWSPKGLNAFLSSVVDKIVAWAAGVFSVQTAALFEAWAARLTRLLKTYRRLVAVPPADNQLRRSYEQVVQLIHARVRIHAHHLRA